MTRLEQLLADLCPGGVEYKTVQAAVGVNRGKRLTKSQLSEDGEYEVYHGSKDSILGKYNQYNAPANTTIVVNTGGIGGVKFLDRPFWCSDGSFWLGQSDSINSKFLYYCLSGYEDYFYSQRRVGGVPTIDRNVVEDFRIPIPPLSVQSEIVQILDNFTESSAKLIADLERERSLRKKQYLEYSHALFTQSDCVKRTTLGEIVDICMCKRIMKVQTDATGDVPFYQNGTLGGEAKLYISNELFQEYSQKYKFPNQGDVMLSTVGTVGKTIQYDGKPAYFQDSNIVWLKRKNEDVTNEYLYWFCVSMPWKLPERATLKHLHNYMIAETEISIPSKERQAYVISKFQELESAFKLIDAALIAETEARQKQYEYYRNKLLTFSNSQ